MISFILEPDALVDAEDYFLRAKGKNILKAIPEFFTLNQYSKRT